MGNKYLILIIVTVMVRYIETQEKDLILWRKLWEDSRLPNICDYSIMDKPMNCFCQKKYNVTETTCWIFDPIEYNDKIWSSFKSQPMLKEVVIHCGEHGKINYVPTKLIDILQYLSYFTIFNASIPTISSYVFKNSSKLEEIVLIECRINYLENNSFALLPKLQYIEISKNNITELNTEVFNRLPRLTELEFSDNNLQIIRPGCFKHLHNLTSLNLSGNSLTVIDRVYFVDLIHLTTLDLSRNEIEMIGDSAYAELLNLEYLNLEGNRIQYISQNGFNNVTQLKQLNLSCNHLKTLDDGIFNNLPSLLVLDFTNNNLKTFEKNTLKNVIENFNDENASLILEGNELTCDCRLRWLYDYNFTITKSMASLEHLICVSDEEFYKDPIIKIPALSQYYVSKVTKKCMNIMPNKKEHTRMVTDKTRKTVYYYKYTQIQNFLHCSNYGNTIYTSLSKVSFVLIFNSYVLVSIFLEVLL